MEALPAALAADSPRGPLIHHKPSLDAAKCPHLAKDCKHVILCLATLHPLSPEANYANARVL